MPPPVKGQIERCYRHSDVAWKRLGARDIAGARNAFEEAYRTKVVGYQSWWVARAVLIRMKDPAWPRASK